MFLTLASQSLDQILENFVPEGWQYVGAALLHMALLFAVFSLCPFFFIWMERKVAGRIQDRLGPTRVGGRFGWLQSLADGIKLIQKEDLCPPAADSMLFHAAPYIVCMSSFAAFIVLPFSEGWVAVAADCGLFIMLAIMSLEVFGIILAGYSSASKWSLFGGMREAAQMVSYEIPMAICALIPIVAAGSLNLGEIGDMQSGGMQNWFLFHDPFTFFAFFVYFVVATASCKRAPFDLAEAESELVGGFHTEYSGMRWSFFFMGEYASMFAVCGIGSILFLGGWNTGLPGVDGVVIVAGEATPVGLSRWRADGGALSYLAGVIGVGVFGIKAAIGVFIQVWLRWTVPRIRIDQVITVCLKYLVPISCFLFLGAIVWPMILQAATFNGSAVASWTFKDLTPGQYRVSATWSARTNGATDAPYTIYDGDTPLDTVDVAHDHGPSGSPDLNDLGVTWQDLGEPYDITGDTLVVELGNDAKQDVVADAILVADAIRVERIDGLVHIIDDGDSEGFKIESGKWKKDTSGNGANATNRYLIYGWRTTWNGALGGRVAAAIDGEP
ncbi:MAG: NADH-quinone oxidoreductase subunit NuoH, partial [Pirellulaceae bacterium]